jgi:hypothetical protein
MSCVKDVHKIRFFGHVLRMCPWYGHERAGRNANDGWADNPGKSEGVGIWGVNGWFDRLESACRL